jgi:hypothetical protein
VLQSASRNQSGQVHQPVDVVVALDQRNVIEDEGAVERWQHDHSAPRVEWGGAGGESMARTWIRRAACAGMAARQRASRLTPQYFERGLHVARLGDGVLRLQVLHRDAHRGARPGRGPELRRHRLEQAANLILVQRLG